VATHDREVIVDGVLQGYFLSTYTARKLGMQTTGNAGGSHNLVVKPGKRICRGLLKKMGRGLLVTELLGHGVNYVTGDYSRGAAGFWVEGGEIVLSGARDHHRRQPQGHASETSPAIGNDVLVRGSKQVGSLLVEQMKVAGA
jgi:PmbA protein